MINLTSMNQSKWSLNLSNSPIFKHPFSKNKKITKVSTSNTKKKKNQLEDLRLDHKNILHITIPSAIILNPTQLPNLAKESTKPNIVTDNPIKAV